MAVHTLALREMAGTVALVAEVVATQVLVGQATLRQPRQVKVMMAVPLPVIQRHIEVAVAAERALSVVLVVLVQVLVAQVQLQQLRVQV